MRITTLFLFVWFADVVVAAAVVNENQFQRGLGTNHLTLFVICNSCCRCAIVVIVVVVAVVVFLLCKRQSLTDTKI